MPVSTDSMLYYNGVHWGFSAFALALGSSYFQRLVEITPTLNAAVRHAPPFAAYAAYMRDGSGVNQFKQQEEYLHVSQPCIEVMGQSCCEVYKLLACR